MYVAAYSMFVSKIYLNTELDKDTKHTYKVSLLLIIGIAYMYFLMYIGMQLIKKQNKSFSKLDVLNVSLGGINICLQS